MCKVSELSCVYNYSVERRMVLITSNTSFKMMHFGLAADTQRVRINVLMTMMMTTMMTMMMMVMTMMMMTMMMMIVMTMMMIMMMIMMMTMIIITTTKAAACVSTQHVPLQVPLDQRHITW